MWGFGSHFRSSTFSDIDILVVVDSDRDELLDATRSVRAAMLLAQKALSFPIHVTVLTKREYAERPLREMDILVPIYSTGVFNSHG